MLDLENGQTLARSLALRFQEAGKQLYLVGGSVRDELLGEPDTDLDFATNARPEETVSLLDGAGGAVYRVGERFGTIGLALPDRTVEITTYRSVETYPPGSRKPEVEWGSTLAEDLARRDFTINAMARDPVTGDLVDPYQGMRDLTIGVVRAVGDPVEKFREDSLRILRAVRFAARFGFSVEPETWEAMCASAAGLRSISRERVRDEYSKILLGPNPALGMTLLRDCGLLAHTVPQLLELTIMPDHGPRHPLSLWDHVMRVVSAVPPRLALRWAALLHDIGKPATRTHERSGRPRFFHHEEVGARLAREILMSLRYANDIIDAVALLVETHMQLHTYSQDWSDGAVRRLMLRVGPLTESAILLARADASGHSSTSTSASAAKFDDLETRVREAGQEEVRALQSPLSGDDLMQRYGRPPGPWIREIKDRLLTEVLEGRIAPGDREAGWKLADGLIASEKASDTIV